MSIIENQIKGLAAIFIILAVVPFIIFFSNSLLLYQTPVFADQYHHALKVEIDDRSGGRGIYFVAPGITANNLLQSNGIEISSHDFIIDDGMKLTVDSSWPRKVLATEINNSRRLALGMNIDINRATEDDLLLISGIGEITARKIIELRNKKERFKDIEELMEVDGIKDKKLSKLRQYLYVQKR